MKKITVAAFILTAFVLALFPSCDDGGDNATELRWRNVQTTEVSEIKWVSTEGDTDQTWSGDFSQDEATAFKEVDLLNGHGECMASGSPQLIYYDDGNNSNYSLDEGSSETITIEGLDEI